VISIPFSAAFRDHGDAIGSDRRDVRFAVNLDRAPQWSLERCHHLEIGQQSIDRTTARLATPIRIE